MAYKKPQEIIVSSSRKMSLRDVNGKDVKAKLKGWVGCDIVIG